MRPPAPTRRRRLLHGAASGAVVLALGACAATGTSQDDAASTAPVAGSTDASADPTPSPGQEPSSEATGTPGAGVAAAAGRPRVVELVSMTAAGGTVTSAPTPVAGEAERARYLGAFDARARARLRTAFAQVDDPRTGELTATVVAVGCVPPEDVDVVPTGSPATDAASGAAGGYEVVAVAARSPDVQCFAPVTTVALVLLPS